MTNLEMSYYWDDVSRERLKLIAEAHRLCHERSVLLEQRRQLLRAYSRLGAEVRESALHILGWLA